MARKPPDPDVVAFALQQVAAGRSWADVAKELTETGYKYTPGAIGAWVRKARAAKAVASTLAVAPAVQLPNALAVAIAERQAAQPPPEPIDTDDTLGTLRALAKNMLLQAAAEKLSNPKLSATLTRSASDVLNTIARVEKTTAEAEDVLRLSRKEIAETSAALLERFKAICERPLLCSKCSRALSVEWGEAAEKIASTPSGA